MPDDATDLATLASRLDAVERALTDADRTPPADTDRTPPANPADGRSDAVEELERSVAELERRVSELAAELDAVRGLVGGVEAVNESVERRADLALATAERVAADREETDGLVVERLPDGDAATSADAAAPDGADEESGDESLADRLRGAL